MRHCSRLWPRSRTSPTPNDGTAAARARSNAPGTTTSRSRNPASPPAPATPDPRPSTSGLCPPHRQPTPGHTPRRVRTHRSPPRTTRTSTKEHDRRPPGTPDHRPNDTSPARHPPAHHTAPADATAPQKHHRPAAQHHDQLSLRGIGTVGRAVRRRGWVIVGDALLWWYPRIATRTTAR
jgi:hypothetical protein